MRIIFDIETNGFLDKLTTVHSLVMHDVDSGVSWSFSAFHGNIAEGLKILAQAPVIIGHNAERFDVPAIQKVYPWFQPRGLVVDTLVLSRLIFPDIKKQIDFDLQKKGKLPGKLMGRHSLESWGYRLGDFKGEYTDWCKEQGVDPWSQWRPEMQEYCEQDVVVTTKLFQRFLRAMANPKAPWKGDCVSLEHAVARIVNRQMERGFAFDEAAAHKLHAKLVAHKIELEDKLQVAFPPKEIVTTIIPKASNKNYGYVKGVPFAKKRVETFNPGSRQMIAARLKEKYGWTPTEFTDGGEPKIDEKTLAGFSWPEAKLLAEYLMVTKRLGQLAEGKEAWLKAVKDGRIYGLVDTNGAFTGRMTHRRPNMTQVPSNKKPYGLECRALFIAGAGWVLVGCDADALELRMLGGYMARFDGGAYIKTILSGKSADGTDMHSVNARALGLDPKKRYPVGGVELTGRDIAKVFFYAFIYGAGDEKLGTIMGKAGDEARALGRKLRRRFLNGLPALAQLIEALHKSVEQRGFLYGLDGRVLPIRSKHAALNTLLQSAGAIIMKRALVILDETLASQALHYGSDYEFVANVHDEWQIESKPEHAEQIGQHAKEAIRLAGEWYGFRCPLAGNAVAGRTWAETH